MKKVLDEAALGTRTRNLLITNQLLCQLSYDGKSGSQSMGDWLPICREVTKMYLWLTLYVWGSNPYGAVRTDYMRVSGSLTAILLRQ